MNSVWELFVRKILLGGNLFVEDKLFQIIFSYSWFICPVVLVELKQLLRDQ